MTRPHPSCIHNTLAQAFNHTSRGPIKSQLPTRVEFNAAMVANNDRNNLVDTLLRALEKAAWFIENVNEDTPNRTDIFFQTRESWRDAFAQANENKEYNNPVTYTAETV